MVDLRTQRQTMVSEGGCQLIGEAAGCMQMTILIGTMKQQSPCMIQRGSNQLV